MKLKLRFIIFFFSSLVLFILFTGVFVLLGSEYLIPRLTSSESIAYQLDILIIIFPFITGGILFGLFFVKPFVDVIMMIRELSNGHYQLSNIDQKFYRANASLKYRYFLYCELVLDLYELARQLEAASQERLLLEEAKTNWIAGVSHDLKTPLSYITGYSSLLLDPQKTWTDEELTAFLNQIHEKSIFMNDLIGDLNLSFKLDTLKGAYPLHKERLDLVEFAKRILADCASNPKAEGYSFEFHSSVNTLWIQADKKLLARAIGNILTNAVLHNPKGTSITMTLSFNDNQDSAILAVLDNGVGMKKEDAGSGGLGLFIAKSIIDAHKGFLHIESYPQQGTEIKISLPCNSQ